MPHQSFVRGSLVRKSPGRLAQPALLIWLMTALACSGGSKPRRTVERFLQAFNDKDVNALLTCIDPKQERLFRASFRIIEKVTGGRLPLEDIFEAIPVLYQQFQGMLPQDLRFTDISLGDAQVGGDDAQINVTMTLVARAEGSEMIHKQTMVFSLRRFEEEGWRITGVQPK
jgi:hypothetical protein